jgi:hypothetical protein
MIFVRTKSYHRVICVASDCLSRGVVIRSVSVISVRLYYLLAILLVANRALSRARFGILIIVYISSLPISPARPVFPWGLKPKPRPRPLRRSQEIDGYPALHNS